MKLKNNSAKIIIVGSIAIFPGKVENVADENENNEAVLHLIKMKKLSIVKEKPTTPKPPRKPANEKPAEEPKTGDEQQPEPEKEPETKKE